MTKTYSLAQHFHEYFEIVSANTAALRERAYRLRYQVLCVEEHVPGFTIDDYPDKLESDEYDQRAIQSLLRYRPTNEFIGTVRLVLCDPLDPSQEFPVERYSAQHFDRTLIDPDSLPRRQTAEITRLLLTKEYRSRQKTPQLALQGHDGKNTGALEKRQRSPQPLLGLLVAIMRMTAANNISYWYAGMKPVLNDRLRHFGLDLKAIGPVVDYHGPRRPYLGQVDEVMRSIYFRDRQTWGLLTEEGTIWKAPKHRPSKASPNA